MTTLKSGGGKTGLTKLTDLYELAKRSRKKKIAVAVAHDEHSLEAVYSVVKTGLVDAILVGSEQKIKDLAGKLGLDLSGMSVINEEIDANAVKRAVSIVRNKEADILMKGNVPTATFLRGVLDKET
jgi:phosphate butyryltransferase